MTEQKKYPSWEERKAKRAKLRNDCKYQLTLWLPLSQSIDFALDLLKRGKAKHIIKQEEIDGKVCHAVFTEGRMITKQPTTKAGSRRYIKSEANLR